MRTRLDGAHVTCKLLLACLLAQGVAWGLEEAMHLTNGQAAKISSQDFWDGVRSEPSSRARDGADALRRPTKLSTTRLNQRPQRDTGAQGREPLSATELASKHGAHRKLAAATARSAEQSQEHRIFLDGRGHIYAFLTFCFLALAVFFGCLHSVPAAKQRNVSSKPSTQRYRPVSNIGTRENTGGLGHHAQSPRNSDPQQGDAQVEKCFLDKESASEMLSESTGYSPGYSPSGMSLAGAADKGPDPELPENLRSPLKPINVRCKDPMMVAPVAGVEQTVITSPFEEAQKEQLAEVNAVCSFRNNTVATAPSVQSSWKDRGMSSEASDTIALSAGAFQEQRATSSDFIEPAASQLEHTDSGEKIAYPPYLGRRKSSLSVPEDTKTRNFSAEDESSAAERLEAAGRDQWRKTHRKSGVAFEGLGDRIPLKDVKLKCKDCKPVVLGEGHFGKVYLARVSQEACAVKTVLHLTRKEQVRLLTELKVLSKLQSRHIARNLGYSVCPDGLVLLTEYFSGGSLTQALSLGAEYQYYNRGKEAMSSVALALAHLHANNIAHLDLKSPNILLSNSGEAKLTGVGLSKFVKMEITLSTTPQYHWTAPEQMQGFTGSDSACDIWSFGTILWEVCTRELPPIDRRLRPILVPKEAPQEVVDLIDSCHKQWDQRITAEELQLRLEACPCHAESLV